MNDYEDTHVIHEDEEISEEGVINKKSIIEKVPYSEVFD